jgi:hypothetical protein
MRTPVPVMPAPTWFSTQVRIQTQLAPVPEEILAKPAFFGDVSFETECEADETRRLFVSAVTTITISPNPYWESTPLTYTWSVDTASIAGSGPTATWTRLIESGRVAGGQATVTVSDGTGESDDAFGHGIGKPFDLCDLVNP